MPHRLGGTDEKWLLASFEDPSKVTWTLAEQIANKLAEGIIRGLHEPGRRLQETALAESFGVSRGPVRDALRILEREGLVTIAARRGASVTRLSRKNVSDIFGVRSVLMGLAAAELARTRSAETLSFLAAATDTLSQALAQRNADDFLALVYRLSMYVAEAADNSLARGILFSLGRQTLSLTRRALIAEANRRTWVVDWKRIVDAISAADPAGADAAARTLVDTVCRATLSLLPAEPDEAAGSPEPKESAG